VAGADAVVSALGPSLDRKATGLPLVEGTRTIIAAMQRHGVRRYVGNGTPSVLDPREKPTWQTRLSTSSTTCANGTISPGLRGTQVSLIRMLLVQYDGGARGPHSPTVR